MDNKLEENNLYKPKPTFYDYWDKNPHIRPWMTKFLPDNPMLSDAIISLIGAGITTCASMAFYVLIVNFRYSEPVFVSIWLLGVVHFLGGYRGRYNVAMIRFAVAKRNLKK